MPRLARMEDPALRIRWRAVRAGTSWKATRLPVFGIRESRGAFQGAKNQSFFCQELLLNARATASRQATASLMTSWVSARPPAPSIIAAATSFDAMSE